jgi:FKBP-type peptidyl-prolyl cis-trans isomerase 2
VETVAESQSEAPLSSTAPSPAPFASVMSGISGLARAACASSTSRRVGNVSRSSSSFRGARLPKAPATIRGTAARSRRAGVTRAVLRDGQLVTIHYVMKFPDGTVGDDTRMRDAPATLPIGQGQLFPKLEKGIAQMEVGEKKTFELKCAEAYGERKDEAVQKFPASPEEVAQLKAQVQPGQMVQLPDRTSAICVAIEDDGVVLDLNHPLSGKDLTFEIELVDVADGPKLFGVPIVPFDPNKVVKKE